MKDLDVRLGTIKIQEENTDSNLFDLGPQHHLTGHIFKGKGNKSKNEPLGFHQDKKLLHGEGNGQQN